MYTLTISQIFSNLCFYKEHYLSIIQSSEQYFTEVEGAFIEVWPFKRKSLYLGDLLQLWFAEKWHVSIPQQLKLEQYLAAMDVKTAHREHQYLYSISGNVLNGLNHSTAWSQGSQHSQNLDLNSTLKYYCEFLNCQRPSRHNAASFKPFKAHS